MADAEDMTSLLSIKSVHTSPDTISKLVKRIRALTLKLLLVEVEPSSLSEATSRVITPQVIHTYESAAGDFLEALPYCLLRARQMFMWDANHNAADYDENFCRAIACEVIARRVVHRAPPERLNSIMSTRYQYIDWDGEPSDLNSALELAIDTHSTIFLSSSEAQHVVNCLWRGDLVQQNNKHHDIDYVPYDEVHDNTFWHHLNPARLCVPRYQNFFRVSIWLIFLIVYSQAVRQPLERLDPDHQFLDEWEIVLYIMALSFTMEEMHKLYKVLRYFSWRAFGFWTAVSVITDGLLVSAFVLRIIGMKMADDDHAIKLHYRSFQVLSFVSPFIWMKLLTVVDGYKWFGTMQICVARMLQESGIFCALLSVLGIGFAQGLYALDAADGVTEHGGDVINSLIQALLQSPDFDRAATNGASLILFYLWNVVTTVILLNVLISLFSSAYQDVVDDAEAQYLAFFAGKTVGMIRAPDCYVYPAPFNIIEVFFVAPWEPFLDPKTYATLNRRIMTAIFFVPLVCIAFFESNLDTRKNKFMKVWFSAADDGEEDDPNNQDPEVVEEDSELKICKVKFADLVATLPDITKSGEMSILTEIRSIKDQLEQIMKKLETKDLSAANNGVDGRDA